MTKHFTILLFVILSAATIAVGQENTTEQTKTYRQRSKYRNLSFVSQEYAPAAGDGLHLKSDYGAAFTTGRTYYLHKKPIAGIIRFGIDATWFDLSYTNYKIDPNDYDYRRSKLSFKDDFYEDDFYEDDSFQMHQADISMQVGASITITPIKKLNVHGYFRVAPTYSAIYSNEEIMGGYGTYYVTGGTLSYGVIGVGMEYRYGKGNIQSFGESDDCNSDECDDSSKLGKSDFSGVRLYLSFRF